MANTFLVLTDNSPDTLIVDTPGLLLEILGNTAGMTFNISSGAGVENLKDGSIVNLDGNYSDYTFQRNGTKMEIRDSQGRLVADMNEGGNSNVTTVNFADISHDITISGSDMVFAGEVVAENGGGGSTGGSGTEQSADLGSFTSPVSLDASTGSFIFTDDAEIGNIVEITGFSSDDVIRVTHADSGDYSFEHTGEDMRITYNNTDAGVVNHITLIGIFDSEDVVGNLETNFETAIGFDAFQIV